ncbi:MAG: isopeptide-forming domain-containing fimbrial protein [Holdemanella sp.]|nr:isopeptide-forming domain-containing fimbrial protein [Holdemanella sp.]
MRNKNIFKLVAMSSMALSGILSGVVPTTITPVYAMEGSVSETVGTPKGVATLGSGVGAITITPQENQSLKGKSFRVYKLFDAENADDEESINYTFNDTYKKALQTVVGKKIGKQTDKVTEYDVIDYIQSLNKNVVEGAQANQNQEGRYSAFRYFVEKLRDEIVKEGIKGTLVKVSEVQDTGSVKLTGLDYGYYVTDEVTTVSGTHSAASLIMVNTANPNATVQIKSDYPNLVKKIDEDDNNVGWNDVADYEIGQTVPYKYETSVPNINGYHTYYFAFHDVMDKALTFDKGSVSVTIKNDKKTYKLSPNEYSVLENEDGETFKIVVNDLKAIVDREFDELNALGENEYGQKITVKYNAQLNDQAALDTGRPGYENKVRLEYSNNPDSDGTGDHGYTPWDTVVAFTYKINGLKINNHNKLLKDAKFRLYSDEACTKEVYVKEYNGAYNVINRDALGGTDHEGGARPEDAVEMVSDKKGEFKIYGLDQGTYYLKETDSPAGYRELLDPIRIVIKPTFTTDRDTYVEGEGATNKILQKLEATAYVKEFQQGAYHESTTDLKTDVDEGAVNITVVNKVGTKLPITGSSLTLICLGAGVVTVLGASKKMKKEEE